MRQRRSGGTRRLHAAVTDGASRAALVCTRSLGRHGLTVGVLCDPEPAAPATYSRHATVTAVMPPPGATAQSRLDALLARLLPPSFGAFWEDVDFPSSPFGPQLLDDILPPEEASAGA